MVYYGYRPKNALPPPPMGGVRPVKSKSYFSVTQYPAEIYNYPLSFQATSQNTMWMIGGLAGAFLFSKIIKFKPISTIGYVASLGAAALALADFVGVIRINTITEKIPEFRF